MQRRSFLASASALLAGPVASQTGPYPSQPIKWIVPYPAGGGTDALARTVAEGLRSSLGQPVLIDNRPGAATNIAGEMVAKSKADGYVLMSADNALLTFNEHLFKRLPFSPEKDFAYVGAMGRFPLVLVAHPSFPANSLQEFIDHVRRNPGQVDYASPGVGTPHHISMELIKNRADLSVTHVAYRGQAPAMTDVMGGQVPVMFFDAPSGMQHILAGKVKALAVGSATRLPQLPNVPTIAESGIADADIFVFQGLLGPAGMPADVVARLNTELNKVFLTPAVKKRFSDLLIEPIPGTPAQFKQMARSHSAVWGQVIRANKLQLDE